MVPIVDVLKNLTLTVLGRASASARDSASSPSAISARHSCAFASGSAALLKSGAEDHSDCPSDTVPIQSTNWFAGLLRRSSK